MVLNDLADSFCHSQKNAGLKGLIGRLRVMFKVTDWETFIIAVVFGCLHIVVMYVSGIN